MNYKDTLTYSDIKEIPYLLRNFKIETHGKTDLKSKDGEVFLLGRGSSGNATIFAKYVWEIYCGVIVNFIHPHSIFNAQKKLNFKNKTVWSFSQSGKSTDIVECSKKLKKWGAEIISVTNEPDIKKNPLAKISDFHILLSSSKEIPVAATKSFALQMYCALKTALLWNGKISKKETEKLPDLCEKLIDSFEKKYKENKISEILKKSSMIGFVGRGPFNAVAEDSALKFREMAFRHSFGYSAAEFLHGPVGAYGKKDLVFILSSKKELTEDLKKVAEKLKERKTPYKILNPFCDSYPFNALLTDIFLKLCALKHACERGINPDYPKGLSKVTKTI
ncbi:MAG: SIS domain-containing protein [Elusimicrobia bacterium]|nr:SIS domain-containing protein [Elusimicrobiota bacterium]